MSNRPVFNKVYDLEYYDASQMQLYIGDVFVDEITSLGYSCSQSKAPLYGYASQLFDDVAAGQVIVQGEFTINFKEQGYLWAILRRWHNIGADSEILGKRKDPIKASKAKALVSGKMGANKDNTGGRPVVGSNGTKISRAGIERLVQGDATRKERYNFYHDLAGYATFDTNSPRDKIFEDIVEAYEDEIWKTSDNSDLLNQLRRTDDNIFDGFDMFVTFGNYSIKKANHTVQKIVGVHLLSQGKMIQVGGGPIQESYSFLAKTVI